MTDDLDPDTAHPAELNPTGPGPDPVAVTRRRVLRAGGALGLAATGVALSGATGAGAGATPAADTPDAPGAFGRPAADQTRARQLRRAGQPAGSTAHVKPGVASTPERTVAPGARLKPNATAVDATPLARRTAGGAWTVEG